MFEYEDVLKRNQTVLGLSGQEIESILNYFCLIGEHHKIYFLWRPFLADPKDDHLLELAIASGTRRIVTFNQKDFKGSDKFGINTISPKEIMEEIS